MEIFDVKALEDVRTKNEIAIDLTHPFYIPNSSYGSSVISYRKIKAITNYCTKKANKMSLGFIRNRKTIIRKSKSFHHYRSFEIESWNKLYNYRDLKKNEGMLCFDGVEEPPQGENLQHLESFSLNEETKTLGQEIEYKESQPNLNSHSEISVTSLSLPDSPVTEKSKSPSNQSVEFSSFHSHDVYSGLDKTMNELLAKGSTGVGIFELKESMKSKFYRMLFDESYILHKIEDYNNIKQKKKNAIERQIKAINRVTVKRTKKPTLVKKYFYVVKKKIPAWKDEIETSGTSITELNTELEEIFEQTFEQEVEDLSTKSEKTDLCEDSDKSLSCPSETGSEKVCQCNIPGCTCDEFVRFQKFMLNKQKAEQKNVEPEKLPKKTEVGTEDRWDDLCHLDDVSQWSEESSVNVTSTSSSSCCIVRKCHCNHCNCGCADYREYLLYKLYQIESRRRKRNSMRAQKGEMLQKIVEDNYEEDEYDRTVRELINEYYVQEDETESRQSKLCDCGLYNCKCVEPSELENQELVKEQEDDKEFQDKNLSVGTTILKTEGSNPAISPKNSSAPVSKSSSYLDDDRKKVWFGIEDKSPQHSQKTFNSNVSETSGKDKRISDTIVQEEGEKETGDIYEMLSDILEKSDTILKFDIDDYLTPEEVPQVKEVQSSDSSYGSFDYKTYLVENECNCEDYMKYYKYKQKTRRLAEKKDPIIKYFRKRLLYLSSLAKAEQLLDHTSSETDCPVDVPLIRLCEKYKFNERKKKIFKKKKRKMEKKVILDIIKKGNHLYPCHCNISTIIDDNNIDICKDCQAHLETEEGKIKTKIEPSIDLGDISEKECVLGLARTFPECPTCKLRPPRIQFTEETSEKCIADEEPSVHNLDVLKGYQSETIESQSKVDVTEITSAIPATKKHGHDRENDMKLKAISKSKSGPGAGKSKKKKKETKGKKGKKGKKKSPAKKGKKKRKENAKKPGGKKKKNPVDSTAKEKSIHIEGMEVNDRHSRTLRDHLDATVSIFDPEIVFKFGYIA